MPNVTISVYLSDVDFVKYMGLKRQLNAEVRQVVKEKLAENSQAL